MPGPINLLPDELSRPKRTGPEEVIPVPREAMPEFGTPAILIPDDFWSNLKQFLFERPVRVIERNDVPFTKTSFGSGLGENLKFYLSAPSVSKTAINKRLEVDWGGNFGSFKYRLKELFFPTKLPPLQVTSKPIKVKEIWSKHENFGWVQMLSIALHAGLIALLVLPLFMNLVAPTRANNKPALDVTPLDISPYVAKLPAGNNKAGGGGGGGDRSTTPATKGKAPKFTMTQFTPPSATIKNPNPKLPMDPTLLGPPDLKVANPALSGAGLGPGEGGGTGGGAFRAGVNGVGQPSCFYTPNPPYSEEARKAKYSGTVLVESIIEVDGRVSPQRVLKSPGLGLDDTTLQTMRTWRCKAALGPNGRAVRTIVSFEVNFRLF